jgi:hypothetical protein
MDGNSRYLRRFRIYRGLLEFTSDGVFLGKTPNTHSCPYSERLIHSSPHLKIDVDRGSFPMAHTDTKHHAHELIERLAPTQIAAVVSLLEVMLDPVAVALANAPYDDEPVSEEEAREIAAARASLACGEGIPHEEVLAEFGLSPEDFERMGRTPLEPEPHPGQ